MSRPLKIDYSTTPISLKEMTDAEIDATFVNPILLEFAADSNGTGALKGSSFGGTTTDLKGTWSDRNRVYNIGDHGFPEVADITSSTYSIFQNTTLSNEDNMVRPLCYRPLYVRSGGLTRNSTTVLMTDTSGLEPGFEVIGTGIPEKTLITSINPNVSIVLSNAATVASSSTSLSFRRCLVSMNNSDLDTFIFSRALTALANQGIGSYHLSTSAPTTPTGATWTSQFSMIDRWKPSSSATKTVWRMTSRTGLPAISARPLKFTENNVNILGDEGLIEMTDTEIRSLVMRFKNRIIQTGIGTYFFRAVVPSEAGTWAQVGESISDLLNVMTNETYAITWTGFFTRQYRKNFFGEYAQQFAGVVYTGVYRTTRSQTFGGGTFITFDDETGAQTTTVVPGSVNTFLGPESRGTYGLSFTGRFQGTYTSYRSEQIGKQYTSYFTGATISSTTSAFETVALWIRRS